MDSPYSLCYKASGEVNASLDGVVNGLCSCFRRHASAGYFARGFYAPVPFGLAFVSVVSVLSGVLLCAPISVWSLPCLYIQSARMFKGAGLSLLIDGRRSTSASILFRSAHARVTPHISYFIEVGWSASAMPMMKLAANCQHDDDRMSHSQAGP